MNDIIQYLSKFVPDADMLSLLSVNTFWRQYRKHYVIRSEVSWITMKNYLNPYQYSCENVKIYVNDTIKRNILLSKLHHHTIKKCTLSFLQTCITYHLHSRLTSLNVYIEDGQSQKSHVLFRTKSSLTDFSYICNSDAWNEDDMSDTYISWSKTSNRGIIYNRIDVKFKLISTHLTHLQLDAKVQKIQPLPANLISLSIFMLVGRLTMPWPKDLEFIDIDYYDYCFDMLWPERLHELVLEYYKKQIVMPFPDTLNNLSLPHYKLKIPFSRPKNLKNLNVKNPSLFTG